MSTDQLNSLKDRIQDITPTQAIYLATASLASLSLLKYFFSNIKDSKVKKQQKQAIKSVIEKKQLQRSSSIQELSSQHKLNSMMKDKSIKILRQNLQQLVKGVKEGQFTLDEVKVAYLMRALDIAVESNYLAEIYMQKANVKVSDSKPRQDCSLYGVIYSVVDWIDQCDFDSTCGIASRALKPSLEDAAIIKALNQLQATPLFRSSVNQGAGSIDCIFTKENSNALWGRALNPKNKEFSTGGSCGGEAGLVSTHSVGIGMGVDCYGDARYSAICSGVCAFKPTSSRISSLGISSPNITPLFGQVVSPIGRHVSDIEFILKCLWNSKALLKYDPSVSPLAFNEFQLQQDQKLTIAYFLTDNLVEPSIPNKTALILTKQILESQGHTLIQFDMGNQLAEAVQIAYKLVNSAGCMREYQNALQGEEPLEEMNKVIWQANLSTNMRVRMTSILQSLRQSRMAIIMDSTTPLSSLEFVELYQKLKRFVRDFTEYWVSNNFDLLITPAGCMPALPHQFSGELFCMNSYFLLFNILDFPAGVVPFKKVTKEDIQEEQTNFEDRNQGIRSQDRIKEYMKLALQDSAGLPVGVQVVSLPNQDEKCLKLMEIIEKLADFNDHGLGGLY